MFTEIDSTLLAILGGTVMGVLQALKPFIPEQYILIALGGFSLTLGFVLTTTVESANLGTFIIQMIANAYFIVVAASGPYSIAKSITKTDNPKGI